MDEAVAQESLEERAYYSPKIAISENADLSEDQKNLIDRLDNFEAPYLEEKLMSEGEFNSKDRYNEAFNEFKKYAALTQIYEGSMAMASKEVDKVWHQFILFTPQYHDFCNNVLGTDYLHHVPKTSYTPSSEGGVKNFVNAYNEVFGRIPSVWGLESDCEEGCMDPDCDTDCSQPSCDDSL